jgi:hypothetical protein
MSPETACVNKLFGMKTYLWFLFWLFNFYVYERIQEKVFAISIKEMKIAMNFPP